AWGAGLRPLPCAPQSRSGRTWRTRASPERAAYLTQAAAEHPPKLASIPSADEPPPLRLPSDRFRALALRLRLVRAALRSGPQVPAVQGERPPRAGHV